MAEFLQNDRNPRNHPYAMLKLKVISSGFSVLNRILILNNYMYELASNVPISVYVSKPKFCSNKFENHTYTYTIEYYLQYCTFNFPDLALLHFVPNKVPTISAANELNFIRTLPADPRVFIRCNIDYYYILHPVKLFFLIKLHNNFVSFCVTFTVTWNENG